MKIAIAQQNQVMNPDYESPIPAILLPSAQETGTVDYI